MTDSIRDSSVGGKKPAYRASCDSCKAAKVRCSQTKPSCSRCLKQEVPCVYGISQRAGKHSADRFNNMQRNTDAAVLTGAPTTPSMSTGVGTPGTSTPSTDDLGQIPLLYPGFLAPGSDSEYMWMQQQKDWTFDPFFNTSDSDISQGSHTLFRADETLMSYPQQQQPKAYSTIYQGVSDAGLSLCGPDGRAPHLSSDESTNSYLPRTPSCQSHSSPSSGTCRYSETIIVQLSSLPVFLHHERCPFDVELVQLQEASRLCAEALACTCTGKDYTFVLTVSMLISRIISVFDRGGASATSNDYFDMVPAFGNSNPSRSPKFSFGMYQLDMEEESRLKQEVWWLQFKKIESLVAGFKEMMTKLKERQIYEDMLQAAAWEKIISLLDQKAQSVKREWMASRDGRLRTGPR